MRTWRRRCAMKIEDAIDDHSPTYLCASGRGRIDHDIRGAGAALALAARRRDRDGQHARAFDLAALRNLSCRSQGEVLRALPLALEHDAAIAVRRAAAGKISAYGRHRGTRHAFNGEETVSGEPGAQGTQMDAI